VTKSAEDLLEVLELCLSSRLHLVIISLRAKSTSS
jgi:hypothetical protein